MAKKTVELHLPRVGRFERIQQRFRVIITIAFASVAISIALLTLRTKVTASRPQHHFDPTMMVRVGDVSRVYAIRQQPGNADRFWLATAEGIRVYSESSMDWRRWGTDHGLPSDWTYDITFADSAVWAATDLGPSVMLPGSGRFRSLLPDMESQCLTVESYRDSLVFAYTYRRGLIRFGARDTVHQSVSFPGLKADRAVTCLRAIDTILYVGTDLQELFAYNPVSGTVRTMHFPPRFSGEAQILEVAQIGGALWVATTLDGLYRSGTTDTLESVTEFPCKGAFALVPAEDGLWAGTPWGLWRYHAREDVWIQFVHPDERRAGDFQVMSLLVGPSRVYYGTARDGAGYMTTGKVTWNRLRPGLAAPNVAAMTSSDSLVYTGFGYRGGYIDCFDATTMQFSHNVNYMTGAADPYVQCLHLRGSRLYFGGSEAFGYTDFATGAYRYFPRNTIVPAFDVTQMIDEDTAMVIATAHGIVSYDTRTDSFARWEQTATERITCMTPQGDSIWYGTLAHGMKVLDRATGKVHAVALENTIRIVAILPAPLDGRRHSWSPPIAPGSTASTRPPELPRLSPYPSTSWMAVRGWPTTRSGARCCRIHWFGWVLRMRGA